MADGFVILAPARGRREGRQRFGRIIKQGSSLLRFLLVEATQVTARVDPEWRRRFLYLAMRRGREISKIAMARRLAVLGCNSWVAVKSRGRSLCTQENS
jgi:transposase